MSSWDAYQARINSIGPTMRSASLKRETRFVSDKIRNSLSYHAVTIDGVEQDVAIVDTDNLNEKFIYSMPGGDITHGGLVEYMDNHWLVTERDASTEVYTRAKMIQCNYLLRWVGYDRTLREQWCIVEDGTKYLTGQYEDRDFISTRGDSRISITIARNEYTRKMKRGDRFLVDDEASDTMLAYELTKPLKVGHVYNGNGVYKFVLQEVNTIDEDNQELRVADYYKYYPPNDGGVTTPNVTVDPDNTTDDGKKVWL